MNCPVCNVQMQPLVEGIFQCPQCKKIIKKKDKEAEIKEKILIEKGVFQDSEYFYKNASLNKKYEILTRCDK